MLGEGRSAREGAEHRQMIAHGVSRGMGFASGEEPRMGRKRTTGSGLGDRRDPAAPSGAWVAHPLEPTAHAVGYFLPVLRTWKGDTYRITIKTALVAPAS